MSRPRQDWLWRAQPDPALDLAVILLRIDPGDGQKRDLVLAPSVLDARPELRERATDGRLVLCQTTRGLVFAWPLVDPSPTDSFSAAYNLANAAVLEEARKRWIGIAWRESKLYLNEPEQQPPDIPWPDQERDELLELALRGGAFITDPDDPQLQTLRRRGDRPLM